jgi:hypothetical protein
MAVSQTAEQTTDYHATAAAYPDTPHPDFTLPHLRIPQQTSPDARPNIHGICTRTLQFSPASAARIGPMLAANITCRSF